MQRMAVRVELTSTGRQLEVGLVTGVTNTQLVRHCGSNTNLIRDESVMLYRPVDLQVRQEVVAGRLNCVLVRPCLVPSPLVLAAAANKVSGICASLKLRS